MLQLANSVKHHKICVAMVNISTDVIWFKEINTLPPWEKRADFACAVLRTHVNDVGIINLNGKKKDDDDGSSCQLGNFNFWNQDNCPHHLFSYVCVNFVNYNVRLVNDSLVWVDSVQWIPVCKTVRDVVWIIPTVHSRIESFGTVNYAQRTQSTKNAV